MNNDSFLKKNLLIINRIQFGYHTDTYYYSKLLKDRFNITYLCYDHMKEKIHMSYVKVVYVSKAGNYFKRNFQYFHEIIGYLKKHKNNVIFINYFPGVSLISFFLNRNNTLLDVRSGSVFYSKTKRNIGNLILWFETKFYKNVSVVSGGLARKLKLKNPTIIPLGAEIISKKEKSFHKMDLLYVGTFYNRNIEVTVEAVAKFVNEITDNITYKIVGFGTKQEEDTIKNRIKDLGMDAIIHFEGRVRVDKLSKYFDSCNIGITYIPVTDYFDHQPPTKLFEYALSGMVNIATATESNKEYINDCNGIICDDNINGLFEALCVIHKNLNHYSSKTIKESLTDYRWDTIIKNTLIPKLSELLKQ